jgi:hypothetical protein
VRLASPLLAFALSLGTAGPFQRPTAGAETAAGVHFGLADNLSSTFAPLDRRLMNGPMHVELARMQIRFDAAVPAREAQEQAAGEVPQRVRLQKWLAAVAAAGLVEPAVTITVEHEAPTLAEYRAALVRLIGVFGGQVDAWGAWNEPDNPTYAVSPEAAAQYWQAARSAALQDGCDCTIVAGEFARDDDATDGLYVARYAAALESYCAECWAGRREEWLAAGEPSVWGIHDYKDVDDYQTDGADLRRFEMFAATLARPEQIWVTEAGVELHGGSALYADTRLVHGDVTARIQRQTAAAQEFLSLANEPGASSPAVRLTRLYYYSWSQPSEERTDANPGEFDSGLVESAPGAGAAHLGAVRPAYCVLAFASHTCPSPLIVRAGAPAR